VTYPQIKILPEDLINKIAAGEVVERPASVVKELVENSIDAKATRIKVEVQQAGRKLIRVIDNGHGMTKEETELAIIRHSTSKIRELDDLFNIKSLGFRGEALPSIASVSQMQIEPNPSGTGVTVRVKDLFYNTPARKKFIKSPATEMGHIGDVVSKYAMANPQIAFELISDGKPLLSTPGSGSLKDALISIYNIDLVREMVEVEQTFKFGRISGLVSRPNLSRVDKTYETFFVNKRYVKNFLLNRALEQAYRTLIPNNRFPVAVIFIEINPKHIDVNVHPTKREIKFSKNNEVMDAIRETVRSALGNTSPESESMPAWTPPMADVLFEGLQSQLPMATQEIEFEVSSIQPLIPIYQYKNTYIICTDGEDLVLIDQHAAHERIFYDKLSQKEQAIEQQTLLTPETLEFSPKEFLVLQENLEYLKGLGLELEEFGKNSFLLRSVPALAAQGSIKQTLTDIAAELQSLGKSAQLEIKQENIRKLVACHSAIKAGDKLTVEEMNQLIRDLYATENPLTCPHGRPTMLRLTESEIEKRFMR